MSIKATYDPSFDIKHWFGGTLVVESWFDRQWDADAGGGVASQPRRARTVDWDDAADWSDWPQRRVKFFVGIPPIVDAPLPSRDQPAEWPAEVEWPATAQRRIVSSPVVANQPRPPIRATDWPNESEWATPIQRRVNPDLQIQRQFRATRPPPWDVVEETWPQRPPREVRSGPTYPPRNRLSAWPDESDAWFAVARTVRYVPDVIVAASQVAYRRLLPFDLADEIWPLSRPIRFFSGIAPIVNDPLPYRDVFDFPSPEVEWPVAAQRRIVQQVIAAASQPRFRPTANWQDEPEASWQWPKRIARETRAGPTYPPRNRLAAWSEEADAGPWPVRFIRLVPPIALVPAALRRKAFELADDLVWPGRRIKFPSGVPPVVNAPLPRRREFWVDWSPEDFSVWSQRAYRLLVGSVVYILGPYHVPAAIVHVGGAKAAVVDEGGARAATIHVGGVKAAVLFNAGGPGGG